MSKVIYKYPLSFRDENVVNMPKNAVILSCQAQGGTITIWALVDVSMGFESKVFSVFGTGHRLPDNIIHDYTFVATVQLSNGLVFHVFSQHNKETAQQQGKSTMGEQTELQVVEAINSCEGRISSGAAIAEAFDWLREELAEIKQGKIIYPID